MSLLISTEALVKSYETLGAGWVWNTLSILPGFSDHRDKR